MKLRFAFVENVQKNQQVVTHVCPDSICGLERPFHDSDVFLA